MVNRRHAENALTAQLEGTDLQNHRERFHHKYAPHNHQQEFLAQQHGDNTQRAAECQRTHIAHKDLCRIGVKPQEAQTRANNRGTDDHQFTGVTQIRDMQVVGEVHVTGRPGHQREAGGNEYGWHNRQPIEAVSQVDRITGPNDNKIGQQDVEQAQLRHHVFKERHHQLSRRRIFTCHIQRKGNAQRNHRHPEVLPASNQTFGIFTHHFAIVIDKADDAVADENRQYAPDVGVGWVSPQQNGDNNGGQDHDPAHGWRTALTKVRFRAIVTYNLAKGEFLQTGDHARAHPQRDEQRGQQADNGAKRQVGKDVKA